MVSLVTVLCLLCSVRSDDVNPLLQTVHSNILILLQFISCVCRAQEVHVSASRWTGEKLLSHSEHLYGFSPVWTLR